MATPTIVTKQAKNNARQVATTNISKDTQTTPAHKTFTKTLLKQIGVGIVVFDALLAVAFLFVGSNSIGVGLTMLMATSRISHSCSCGGSNLN